MADVREGVSAIVFVTFKSANGQPMAATGVTIRARRPNGTEVVGTVVPGAGTGLFEAQFVCDLPGVWLAKAECTGPEVARDDVRWTCSRLRYDET